jgi:hypothetical protein
VRFGHLKAYLADVSPIPEPKVTSIGVACYEVQMPEDEIHIVGAEMAAPQKARQAFCFTCNTDRCEAIAHIYRRDLPPVIALPLPAEPSLAAAA